MFNPFEQLQIDRFSTAHQSIAINGTTATKNEYDGNYRCAYGSIPIRLSTEKIYEWKIKINKREFVTIVGITSNKNVNGNHQVIDYGYSAHDGYKYTKNACYPYGQNLLKAGDVIKMIINAQKREIRFAVNNKDQGVAFNNISVGREYFFVYATGYKGDSITIQSFSEEMNPQQKKEVQEMNSANEKFNTNQKETQNLNNYISCFSESKIRQMIKPSYWNNNWADVDYKFRLVYTHEKCNGKKIYVWEHCKIFCKAKKHIIFNHDESDWPNVCERTSNSIGIEIENKLQNTAQCTECKNEIEAAKKKVSDFETKQDNFLKQLQEVTDAQSTAENVKLSEVTKLESDLNKLFAECKNDINDVNDIVNEAKNISQAEEGTTTYETKLDLNEFINKAASGQDKISQEKKKLFMMDNQLNEAEIALMKTDKNVSQDIICVRGNKIKLNKHNENIDKLQNQLRTFMENKCVQKIVCDELKQIHLFFDSLLQQLHEKYIENEQRMKELKQCQDRINTIRAKLDKQKGENKYLMQLLNEEYNRLSTATQSAMQKFEENGIYFLSVTVGLKQDIIDKFVEIGCDKLDDIKDMTEEDLKEIGVASKVMRNILLKHIGRLNEKFQENS